MYTPQPIAVHTNLNRQNFRRGDCAAYDNPLLRVAPNFLFPNIMVKRLTSGEAPTVKLYRLTDAFISTLTPASVTNYALDTEGEYEMMVLGAGNWTGIVPSDIIGTQCYLLIETTSQDYYTDEFLVMDGASGFPPDCGENWAKISWVLNGTCIVSGKTATNEAVPISGYPLTDLTNFVYWKANTSRPEWEFEEKGEPDAHGVNVPETRRLVKRWSAEGVPVSESVSDALTVAALSDTVTIDFPDGTVYDGVKDIQTDISWEQGGCSAIVKFNFSTDYFVKQGCC